MPLFVDKDFPPCAASLGSSLELGPISPDSVKWARVTDLCKKDWDDSVELFKDGVSPEDIKQGYLGNCWMLAGFACVARKCPWMIEQRFASPLDPDTGKACISKDGRYIVQLWDADAHRWVSIPIDDLIPAIPDVSGRLRPLFSKSPDGNEAWVLLLEKAFAKYMGSYAAANGGLSSAAMLALAGDQATGCLAYVEVEDDLWAPFTTPIKPVPNPAPGIKRKNVQERDPHAALLKGKQMFHKLRKWLHDKEHEYVIGAGSIGRDDSFDVDGVVTGHAYGILEVVLAPGFTLVQLANPHGAGGKEWEGDWCDSCPMWKEHPDVAKACGFTGAVEDGTFWMEWSDFDNMFDCLFIMRVHKSAATTASTAAVATLEEAERELKQQNVDQAKADKEVEYSDDDCFDDTSAHQDQEVQEDGESDWEEEGEDDDQEAELQEVFQMFDYDESGRMNQHELAYAIQERLGKRPPRNVVLEIVSTFGGTAKKGVTFDQFKEIAMYMDIIMAFLKYDQDNSGYLTVEELVTICNEMEKSSAKGKGNRKVLKRQARAAQKAKAQLARFDGSGDGKVSFAEFFAVVAEQE